MSKSSSSEDKKALLVDYIQSNQLPTYRQGYSDRIAWLMAHLSELAYMPFDEVDAEIEKIGLSVEQKYDTNGTEALLVSNNTLLILAFKGHKAKRFKDIKTEANARKVSCETNGGVHAGFKEAYEQIASAIQTSLNKEPFAHKPLLITGHGIGGALATIAAKRLNHQGGVAACYTFGAPRVGDEAWSYAIKTPIYRVVNAIDCVTMLPPGKETMQKIKFCLGLVPVVGKFVKYLGHFEDYFHVGDERFLTSCKPNRYDEVELTYKVSWERRLAIFIKGKTIKKFLKDHSVAIYREKLNILAHKRNRDR